MPRSPFEPCIPTKGTKVPDRPEWLHEIKHDGYRLIVQRDGKRVRLFTRNGHDWSDRFPLITEAALRNRNSIFVIDGEAVLLGVDGRSDFNGLHSRKHDDEVQFYAFDMLVSDGDDLRKLPLTMRKTNLARLLARRVDGIFLSDFEQGEIGPDLFRHACLMGLEGLVSKHRESPYRGGRFDRWVKVKNRAHPCVQPGDGSVWLARARLLRPSSFARPSSGCFRRPRPNGPALSGRRLGRLSTSSSSDGLCGRIPSSRSRFALLRIAQRGRCNRSISCDTECVGHKVVSSRSSSSVQRDIAASFHGGPQRDVSCLRFRVAAIDQNVADAGMPIGHRARSARTSEQRPAYRLT